jgi:ribonuclease HI
MRNIYQGVVVPQLMYGCSLWSNSSHKNSYTAKTLKTLQNIQSTAARIMSGAYRATSCAALDVETYLLPVKQQIWSHNIGTISTILTRQTGNEFRGITRDGDWKRYRSPLGKIYAELPQEWKTRITNLERIPPYITPPWWESPRTYIEESAKKAKERHERDRSNPGDTMHLYTDASGKKQRIGAAATCLETGDIRKAFMEDDKTTTIFAAELQGIVLALSIIIDTIKHKADRREFIIYTDNQAAVRAAARPAGKSGAYILKKIVKQLQTVQAQGSEVKIKWIPAHERIQGNDEADNAARAATGWSEDGQQRQPAEKPTTLLQTKAAMRTWIRKEAVKQWTRDWEEEAKGRSTFRYTPKPTARVLKLHKDRSKRQSAILIQLRTEKIGLKDFLFERRVPGITDPECECREGKQTVQHVLLSCRIHKETRTRHLGHVPGGTNLRTVLNDRNVATKAIEFIEQTQLLKQFRTTVPIDEPSAGGRL